MKKRLLKDLPFGGLNIGVVLDRVNNGYQISRGETFYSGGGSSSNPTISLDKEEESIIDEIWENEVWFEKAELKHIEFIPSNTCITLRFKSMDKDEVIEFMKGLIHILPEIEKGSYVWNKFNNITTEIKNN